ncbi:MAG: EFR1 family ferrodoxin, partial [Megasphaera elsdenii]|nr:EFR1 family ferrodoxin [Megasphaera elsdenii]
MILYFSGTGNSLYVAKKLAELTGDTAVPISAIHERCQRIQDRIIGFVFPVYFGDLPDPVQDFIRQVRFQKSTYFYGIATCGSTAGRALKTMDRILQHQQCALSYGAVLPMIANSTIASRRHIRYDTNRLDHADELIAA